MSNSPPQVFTFAHAAMATEFEVVIAQPGMDEATASSAAHAIFAEIERLEEELSRFRPTSEVWRISTLRSGQSTIVDLATWDCLALAKAVHTETAGAFDITIGPLMQLWRNPDGTPRTPATAEIESVIPRIGSHLYQLDEASLSITVHADRIAFDLGGIGKGYALDQSVRLLEEHNIQHALISAGESTILALGQAPGCQGWPITLHLAEPHDIMLCDKALSCSGFAIKGSHIMDPRTHTPLPISDTRAYVTAPTAALSDALSTAFLVMQPHEVSALLARFPEVSALHSPQAPQRRNAVTP
jgi:thiamine biosynthesis lipoprotein